jgi:hypothetical protein
VEPEKRPPHACLHEPEQQLVSLFLIHRPAAPVEVPHYYRHAEATEKDLVMGIHREGVWGQHRILNAQTSQSRFEAR